MYSGLMNSIQTFTLPLPALTPKVSASQSTLTEAEYQSDSRFRIYWPTDKDTEGLILCHKSVFQYPRCILYGLLNSQGYLDCKACTLHRLTRMYFGLTNILTTHTRHRGCTVISQASSSTIYLFFEEHSSFPVHLGKIIVVCAKVSEQHLILVGCQCSL